LAFLVCRLWRNIDNSRFTNWNFRLSLAV